MIERVAHGFDLRVVALFAFCAGLARFERGGEEGGAEADAVVPPNFEDLLLEHPSQVCLHPAHFGVGDEEEAVASYPFETKVAV